MTEKVFINADEVALICGCSKASAYRVIKLLNEELRKAGKLTFQGKTSRQYFLSKVGANG